jgi:guanylate kinase
MNAGAEKSGTLFILSAPSGTGKTTICNRVCERVPQIVFSISYTTRSPRAGERQGVDYYFVPKGEFERKIKDGQWAEWARVHDNYYGTSAQFLDTALARHQTVLLDIDVQGAAQIRKRYPDCVTVFIMPPSMEALQARLEDRQTDDAATIRKRLVNAEKEIAQKDLYHHIIVNDDLQKAVDEMVSLILRYSR